MRAQILQIAACAGLVGGLMPFFTSIIFIMLSSKAGLIFYKILVPSSWLFSREEYVAIANGIIYAFLVSAYLVYKNKNASKA